MLYIKKKYNFFSYNIIVGNPLTLKAWATFVNLVQSTRPTRIDVACKYCATWAQIGSNLLQCAHHGAYIYRRKTIFIIYIIII